MLFGLPEYERLCHIRDKTSGGVNSVEDYLEASQLLDDYLDKYYMISEELRSELCEEGSVREHIEFILELLESRLLEIPRV